MKNQNERATKRIALIILFVVLIIEVLANHFKIEAPLNLLEKLLLASIFGFISFSIMELLPKLKQPHKFLVGLYYIYYPIEKETRCSVLNVKCKFGIYNIHLIDYIKENGTWTVANNRNLKKAVFDFNEQEICLLITEQNSVLCISLHFASENNSGEISVLEKHKNSEGKFIRLSDSHLCLICNENFGNHYFCNIDTKMLNEKCNNPNFKRGNCKDKYSKEKLKRFLRRHFISEDEQKAIPTKLHEVICESSLCKK